MRHINIVTQPARSRGRRIGSLGGVSATVVPLADDYFSEGIGAATERLELRAGGCSTASGVRFGEWRFRDLHSALLYFFTSTLRVLYGTAHRIS